MTNLKIRATNQQNTPTRIKGYIAEAKRSLFHAKDSAANAAAYAYLVHRETEADQGSAEWLEREIKIRNGEIEQFNKAETDEHDRLTKHPKPGKTAKIDREGVHPEAWKLDLQVPVEDDPKPIKAKKGSSPFTRLVKFIFHFDRAADASNTSRYAAVLEWIDTNCSNAKGASEIVLALKKAGGFDKVVGLQRLSRKAVGSTIPTKSDDDLHDMKNDKTAQSQIAIQRETLMKAAPFASFNRALDGQSDDFVLLIGRYDGGKIDILGTVQTDKDELNSMLGRLKQAPDVEHESQPAPSIDIAA